MKLMLMPNNKDLSLYDADSFLLGIKDLAVNQAVYFDLEEVEKIVKELEKENKEVFISLNKNMHNNDLELLKDTLLRLNDINIKGVFFYDAAVVNLKNKLNLKYDLVWNQEHLVTNYATCNYWYNLGVKYACLSNELTLDELQTIRDNTNMSLIVMMYGYIPMFTSKRKLINNYLKYFNIDNNSKNYKIYKEEKYYPILNDNHVTTVYSSHILNGIKESDKLNRFEYILINGFNLDDDKINRVIYDFRNNIDEFDDDKEDKGFLYKETIYKVKK